MNCPTKTYDFNVDSTMLVVHIVSFKRMMRAKKFTKANKIHGFRFTFIFLTHSI